MNVLFEVLTFVFAAALTGFVSANVARALDFGMDYGHYIDWIRLNRVRKAAAKINELDTFEEAFLKRKLTEDYGERIDAVDQLYWMIASKYNPLTVWLCDKCMSHRINFAFSILATGGLACVYGFGFQLIIFYIISFSFNHYFIKS